MRVTAALGISIAGVFVSVTVEPVMAGAQMFGGVGNGSANRGEILDINPANGLGVFFGPGVSPDLGLSGLDFNSAGGLYGSTIISAGTSLLARFNPSNGTLMSSIAITDAAGALMSIGDLSFQPGTDVLYGIRSNTDGAGLGGLLYTISVVTGQASFVGDTLAGAGGGLAFTPDGTLYQTSYNNFLDFFSLNELNPANAARIITLPTINFYDGLAAHPTNGLLYSTLFGPGEEIYTLSTAGVETFIGLTGIGSPSDLAFVIPGPGTLSLLAGAAIFGRRRRPRK